MNVRARIITAGVGAITGAALALGLLWLTTSGPRAAREDASSNLTLSGTLATREAAGFARADRIRPLRFPRDHGPHPAFRNEWWYFTGNLQSGDGRRFGYELSLFRFALRPPPHPARHSQWATDHVYMAHFAVTNAAGKHFHFFERFARNAVGLAGAQAAPFRVWVEDWSVEADTTNGFPWRLRAAADGLELTLELTAVKPIVLQGDRGLSQKSAEPGNASYYYSITRLDSRGTLLLNGERLQVAGQSWMDREWGTSALSEAQQGWDWFALQLADGHDLMFYQLRRKDGSIDPHSAGALVDPRGRITRLGPQDVGVEVLEVWHSPRGGRYPARWRLTVEPLNMTLEVAPVLADQELDVSIRYWEGAVDVGGRRNGETLGGRGYVELTGYGTGGDE